MIGIYKNFKEGDRVIYEGHPEFGVGIIRMIEDGTAIIDFEHRKSWISTLSSGNYVKIEDEDDKSSRIRWYSKGKLDESANPFKTIKDYGIDYIIDNAFYNNILFDYPTHYDSYLRLADTLDKKDIELLPHSLSYVKGKKLKKSFSQYLKFLNSIFLNKLIIILNEKNGQTFISKIKVKSVIVDKTEKDVAGFIDKYDQKFKLRGYGIIDVDKYIDLRLKNLIGVEITFHAYRPVKKKFGKSVFVDKKDYVVENFLLKKIYIDPKTDEICFVDDKGKVEKVNIFSSIKGKKIYSPEDPYGEEDWLENDLSENKRIEMFESFITGNPGLYGDDDDIHLFRALRILRSKEEIRKDKMRLLSQDLKSNIERFKNFDNYLLFDRLGLWRLNLLRKFLEGKIVVIEQSVDKKRTKGRVISIGQHKVNDDQYYSIKMMTKTGEVEIGICGKDRFKVKDEKVKKTKIDPYGEEDWELFSSDAPPEPSEIPPTEKKPTVFKPKKHIELTNPSVQKIGKPKTQSVQKLFQEEDWTP